MADNIIQKNRKIYKNIVNTYIYTHTSILYIKQLVPHTIDLIIFDYSIYKTEVNISYRNRYQGNSF